MGDINQRGFGSDTYHKNGTARVERYFACSKCVSVESIKWSVMLPHDKDHNDNSYRFRCCKCGMLTAHHDIGHLEISKSFKWRPFLRGIRKVVITNFTKFYSRGRGFVAR